MHLPLRLMLTAAVALFRFASFAQAPPSVDDEIARLRKELAKTQADCRRAIDDAKKDKKDFEAYRARTAERFERSRAQLDTLRQQIAQQQHGNDELAAQIAAVQARHRDIELSQEEFRKRLIDACGRLQPSVNHLPPVALPPVRSALSLLSSELSAGTIDIVEGCSRLVQLLDRLEETTSTTQIAQENSPVPDIRGTVYRLRIGSFFEAVVDVKGERCAFFEGWGDGGAPRWKVSSDMQVAAALLQAVNIREGRSLPAFVNIPLAPSGSRGEGL